MDAEYPVSPKAVRLALDMLIAPYLNELSNNERVNMFVYLASTMAPAWIPVMFQHWTPRWRTSSAATSKALRRLAPSRESGSRPRSGTLSDSGFSGLAWSGAIMLKAPCLASRALLAKTRSGPWPAKRRLSCRTVVGEIVYSPRSHLPNPAESVEKPRRATVLAELPARFVGTPSHGTKKSLRRGTAQHTLFLRHVGLRVAFRHQCLR